MRVNLPVTVQEYPLPQDAVRKGWADPMGGLHRLPIRGPVIAATLTAAVLSLGGGACAWSEATRLAGASSSSSWPPALLAAATVGNQASRRWTRSRNRTRRWWSKPLPPRSRCRRRPKACFMR